MLQGRTWLRRPRAGGHTDDRQPIDNRSTTGSTTKEAALSDRDEPRRPPTALRHPAPAASERRPDRPTTRTSVLSLVAFLAVTLAASAIGALTQGDGVGERYLALELPAWAPPQDAFGIVWPFLYVLIAVAAWRVWRVGGSLAPVKGALSLWLGQLMVNAAWPGVFFGLEEFGWAVAVIVLLDVLVVATIAWFARIDRWAALLLTPYLLWILYATALNVAVWQLN
jgi:translocator protein